MPVLSKLAHFPQPPLYPFQMPVMLMHGMGLMGTIGRKGMMDSIALFLRLHGCKAFAPNVAPYNHTEARALAWRAHLLRILQETGADKVHLMAHSLGGLDARYLVSNLDMAAHVAQITTIATPHHGSSLATLFLKQPKILTDRKSVV